MVPWGVFSLAMLIGCRRTTNLNLGYPCQAGRSLREREKSVPKWQFCKKNACSMVGGDWRLAVGGDWWLAVGGDWRLAVGGDWWLAVGGDWRLAAGGDWRLAVGGWWRLVAVSGGSWLVIDG